MRGRGARGSRRCDVAGCARCAKALTDEKAKNSCTVSFGTSRMGKRVDDFMMGRTTNRSP